MMPSGRRSRPPLTEVSVRSSFVLCVLVGLLAALSGCAQQACHCDLIATESECVQFSASDNPLYTTQLQASCTSVLEGLCSTLGGAYTFGTPCPLSGAVAQCDITLATYSQRDVFYSTGGSPVTAGSTEPDEACSDQGVVTWY